MRDVGTVLPSVRRAGAATRIPETVRVAFAALVMAALGAPRPALAQQATDDPKEKRIRSLESAVQRLVDEIKKLKQQRDADKGSQAERDKRIAEIRARLAEIGESEVFDADSWVNRFTLGGYGEFHANFAEGDAPDLFDIHRLVIYLGYDFNDWIRFHSETEIEHAFVSDDSGGELSLEQAFVDFLGGDAFNVRVGRVLTPLGIVNKKHEPPTFNGVERPSFAKFIIPTTWSSDGLGIFGNLTPSVKYEAYIVGGLDGSALNAKDGIRGGRIKERPSLHEPALTGRLDWYPFAEQPVSHGQTLRLGASAYAGGLDNGNKGKSHGKGDDIQIYSTDFEYTIWVFDFRGAVAFERIDDARRIGHGAAQEIFGWYAEAGCHVLPDACKKGKLAKADAIVFVRFDDFDTQFKMPSGVRANPAGDRTEWTFGVNFYLTPTFVLKADYQVREDKSDDDLADLINLGVGWQF